MDALITYETALLAKENEFNENTYSNCWVKTLDGEIIHNSKRKNCAEHDRSELYLFQPTQTHLQKWLRKFHIHISIDFNYITKEYFGYVKNHETKYRYELNIYKEYEDILEEGLQKGLQLIKKHKK